MGSAAHSFRKYRRRLRPSRGVGAALRLCFATKEPLSGLAAAAPVGRLATVTGTGHPHLVPVCFVIAGDIVYSAVDHKPKATLLLKRLANVESNPAAELLIDHYEEDWSRLWWVRGAGHAAIVSDPAERARAIDLLAAKYPQYRDRRPEGAVLRLVVTHWTEWRADTTAGAPPSG